ncbi:MAG: FtsX-like permease family protein [Solirubrobacteraceae bacterium]
MKPSNALRLYRVRLRARLLQECFAFVGIAAGVALLFASQVATSSLQSSVSELTHGIAGRATLQLLARGPHGFPAGVLQRVRDIHGVRAAAPLLEAGGNAIGPAGSASVELVGADTSLAKLGGALVRHVDLAPFGGFEAVVLPTRLAASIGVVKFGQEATFQIAGRSTRVPLYSQLRRRQIGSLVESPVAVVPLFLAQQMTGLRGRVSRILVEPTAGSAAGVHRALVRLAGGRLNVEPTSYDETLFARAAAANNQATELFAVISALVGFLFAFNAMLLTVPQRRRLIGDLRRDGYTPLTVVGVLLLDGVALGLVGCVLGLALGDELSIHLLHSNPAFLSLAFALGSQRVVTWQSVAFASAGGMGAAIVAVLSPLRDILSSDPLAAVTPPVERSSARPGGRLALAGLACLAAATAVLLAAPQAAIPGMVLLVGALLLELPIVLTATLALVRGVAASITSTVPHVASMELSAARTRAIAIASTGAIAVFGSVAIQGAHDDLLAGLEGAARETNAPAQVWVAPAGEYNLLQTAPFVPTRRRSLERLPGVRSVSLYRSGLLDLGPRRVWVLAPPRPLLANAQILGGNAQLATERLRTGGWLVLSQALAAEHRLHIGQALTLPSPHPTTFRLAATSTNLSWAPGAIVMNASDYARAWGSGDASAYAIQLAPGLPTAAGVREIELALGSGSGLAVQSAAAHAARQDALSRQALARLKQIALLILVVAVLAMAAAMGGMVWQRRPRLAKLKLEGIARAELWRTILLENLLLLSVGCLTGALFGLYGQQLADRALAGAVNFPVAHAVTGTAALRSLALVTAAAFAILAVPGYLAAGAPAALALQD